jgi:hypothetical protein
LTITAYACCSGEEAKNRLAAIAPLADALISLGSPGPAPAR